MVESERGKRGREGEGWRGMEGGERWRGDERDGGGRKGEGWRGEEGGGMGRDEKGGMEKGEMRRDGEGRDREGWRGHGVVWSEGGRGSRAHSLKLVVARSSSPMSSSSPVFSPLPVSSSSPVSVHGRWLSFVNRGGCFGRWWVACVVVRGRW